MVSRLMSTASLIGLIITVLPGIAHSFTGNTTPAVGTTDDLLPANGEGTIITVAQNDLQPESATQTETAPSTPASVDSELDATTGADPASTPAAPSTPPSEVTIPEQSTPPSEPSATTEPVLSESSAATEPVISEPPAVTEPVITEPPAVTKTAASQTDIADSQTVASDEETDSTAVPEVVPGTIIITSVPDSVNIVINDVSVGLTPYHATGFYPGIYEITLHKDGYEPFRHNIDLKENGTEFITGTLQPEVGYLFVTSVPESATVILNDTASGITPFSSKPLQPGIYNLRVEAPNHTPYAEQLSITSKITDTIQVSLIPLKKKLLPEPPARLKKSQLIRRIAFGAVTVVSGGIGIYLDRQTKENLDEEKVLYKEYFEARNKTTEEYTQLYKKYEDKTKDTDRYASFRNAAYTIGIICGVCFAVSIPF